jgi:hypothetical protein
MGWVRDVEFTDQEIDDLYTFLRQHDGQKIAFGRDGDRPGTVRDVDLLIADARP